MIVFDGLIAAHVVTGSVGLVSLWAPVVTKKGNDLHKRGGRIFVYSMLSTGLIAVAISTVTLLYPLETHDFWTDKAKIRGMFGWVMLYLGVMTVALAWHSFQTVRHKFDRRRYGSPVNIAVQAAMNIAAVNCAIQGYLIEQYLMVGIAVPGFVASILNTYYLVQKDPPVQEWLVQHFRGGIGAGISVYTAFFAFGAVNTIPALAFNPVLWALPTILGVGYMIRHQYLIFRMRRKRAGETAPLAT